MKYMNREVQSFTFFVWLLYAFAIIDFLLVSKASFANVFIGTVPLFLYALSMTLLMYNEIDLRISWALPLVFSVGFAALGLYGNIELLGKLSIIPLAFFNMAYAYLVNIVLFLIDKSAHHRR